MSLLNPYANIVPPGIRWDLIDAIRRYRDTFPKEEPLNLSDLDLFRPSLPSAADLREKADAARRRREGVDATIRFVARTLGKAAAAGDSRYTVAVPHDHYQDVERAGKDAGLRVHVGATYEVSFGSSHTALTFSW